MKCWIGANDKNAYWTMQIKILAWNFEFFTNFAVCNIESSLECNKHAKFVKNSKFQATFDLHSPVCIFVICPNSTLTRKWQHKQVLEQSKILTISFMAEYSHHRKSRSHFAALPLCCESGCILLRFTHQLWTNVWTQVRPTYLHTTTQQQACTILSVTQTAH